MPHRDLVCLKDGTRQPDNTTDFFDFPPCPTCGLMEYRRETAPDDHVCDFCSSTPIVGGYECDDFLHLSGAELNLETDQVTTMDWGSTGGWAACAECERLIDAGDREGVTERSIAIFRERYGLAGAGAQENILRSMWTEMHGKFFAHKTGRKLDAAGKPLE